MSILTQYGILVILPSLGYWMRA